MNNAQQQYDEIFNEIVNSQEWEAEANQMCHVDFIGVEIMKDRIYNTVARRWYMNMNDTQIMAGIDAIEYICERAVEEVYGGNEAMHDIFAKPDYV